MSTPPNKVMLMMGPLTVECSKMAAKGFSPLIALVSIPIVPWWPVRGFSVSSLLSADVARVTGTL